MRIGVDIGGTFTDAVVFDEAAGSIHLAKTLSTHHDLAVGVRDALGKSRVPLADVQFLIHGSTIVINPILERKGAKTALLTTKGFRDVYEIGRINRPESFNPRFKRHQPLVPRHLIFEIPERILADGSVRQPLDEQAAREVAAVLREEQVEAAAILFLHSYRSPQHEQRMAAILREEVPGLFVSMSHELSREYREYERTSTVAANAFVGPKVSAYLAGLDAGLRDDGFAGSLLIMQSNGGLADVELARRQCVQMMESGPAGGVVGVQALCELLNVESAIAFDMGGTTAKACVIQRGQPELSPDYFVGGYSRGLVIRIPVLDIVEVGTGGGSIAWFDEGGGLHVGPQSAGADPGPACYGQGGTEATITDANVVLGRLSPEAFLGGEMALDVEAARSALRRHVAEPLGVDLQRAASGMIEVATSHMANAVRQVTLQRGFDPRDFTLFTYGGGGALHASAVARELAIRRVVIPRMPGVFSALGMLLADLRRDYVQTWFERLDDVDMDELERQFQALEEEGKRSLAESGIPTEDISFERAADMRYVGQEHAVTVGLPASVGFEDARDEVKRRFDGAHQQQFSHSAEDEPAEIVSLRAAAVGRLPKPVFPRIEQGGPEPPAGARKPSRRVVFAAGELEAAVYDRASLLAGNVIHGPAVIEEDVATTILEPLDRITVDGYGFLIMDLAGE
ncbi:MAG TPA: hydantoinase/oxoprolinase family protein [Chloroflexota bacterium]|nr:hydantoinase/oxoprolinase family protein [Chloroflexota bacterium]